MYFNHIFQQKRFSRFVWFLASLIKNSGTNIQILANVDNTLSQGIPRADTVFTTFLFKLLFNSFFLVLDPYWKFKILFQVLDLGKHVAPLAPTFCIPLVETNYGKFNIRFKGAVLWIMFFFKLFFFEGSLKCVTLRKFKQSFDKGFILTFFFSNICSSSSIFSVIQSVLVRFSRCLFVCLFFYIIFYLSLHETISLIFLINL